MNTKVGVVSLGCDKNRFDTEVMLANLSKGGYEIVSSPEDADVIIVNTCAFLESARKEAIQTAFEMAGYKNTGKCKKVIITGCLGQKFGKEVFDEMHEVDAVIGIGDYDKICDIVGDTLKGERKLYQSCANGITFGDRILTTAPHTSYLKIADGCDNYCTYCLIPHIRGRFRSVEMDKIIEQATVLAKRGVKELILVAQDVTRYGKDLYGEYKLAELLRQLSDIDGIVWIRLLYCYPELIDDNLIEEIAANDKIVNYIDIPLQHVNEEILHKMNRRSNAESIRNLFKKLTEKGIQVRSTFICGFPGETRSTIKELETFLLTNKLRNVGFFAYSREKGTPAAKFENQVAEYTKQSYVNRMYKAQYKVVDELNRTDVGNVFKCIIDKAPEFSHGKYFYVGRTYFMSPEIDGQVFIVSKKELTVGEFYDVKITDAVDYDLQGEVV